MMSIMMTSQMSFQTLHQSTRRLHGDAVVQQEVDQLEDHTEAVEEDGTQMNILMKMIIPMKATIMAMEGIDEEAQAVVDMLETETETEEGTAVKEIGTDVQDQTEGLLGDLQVLAYLVQGRKRHGKTTFTTLVIMEKLDLEATVMLID